MRYLLVALLACLCLPSCKTASEAEIESAVLYFPPKVKHTEEARFCFDLAERVKAVREFDEMEADTLFELVIDRRGNVKKARLVRTYVEKAYRQELVDHAYRFKFSELPGGTEYCAFYWPTTYRMEHEFEWAHR